MRILESYWMECRVLKDVKEACAIKLYPGNGNGADKLDYRKYSNATRREIKPTAPKDFEHQGSLEAKPMSCREGVQGPL